MSTDSKTETIRDLCESLGINYDDVSPIGAAMPNWEDSFEMIERVLTSIRETLDYGDQPEPGEIAEALTDVYTASGWAWLARNYTMIDQFTEEMGAIPLDSDHPSYVVPMQIQNYAYYNLAAQLIDLLPDRAADD
jgi:hypothetical protein